MYFNSCDILKMCPFSSRRIHVFLFVKSKRISNIHTSKMNIKNRCCKLRLAKTRRIFRKLAKSIPNTFLIYRTFSTKDESNFVYSMDWNKTDIDIRLKIYKFMHIYLYAIELVFHFALFFIIKMYLLLKIES